MERVIDFVHVSELRRTVFTKGRSDETVRYQMIEVFFCMFIEIFGHLAASSCIETWNSCDQSFLPLNSE